MGAPAAVGMLVNALYNIVDTIFVGQGVGPLAIAALSIVFPT
jgi:Na+-driven multidrug efflux pump